MIDYVKSDLFRYSGDTTFKSFIKAYLLNPGFKVTFYFRLCKYLRRKSKVLYAIARYIYLGVTIKYGIDLPVGTTVGYGLYIGHFGGIIISGKSIIGNNVNISHGCTIGVNIKDGVAGYPTIGDMVFIGPGAIIIGNTSIGEGCCVGANAVVTKDCPPKAVVVGTSSKIVAYKEHNDFILNIVNK